MLWQGMVHRSIQTIFLRDNLWHAVLSCGHEVCLFYHPEQRFEAHQRKRAGCLICQKARKEGAK